MGDEFGEWSVGVEGAEGRTCERSTHVGRRHPSLTSLRRLQAVGPEKLLKLDATQR